MPKGRWERRDRVCTAAEDKVVVSGEMGGDRGRIYGIGEVGRVGSGIKPPLLGDGDATYRVWKHE